MPHRRLALPNQIPPKGPRGRGLGYDLMDLLVVAACTVTFVTVVSLGKHAEPKGPPFGAIARGLGTTPQQFQQAAERFLPRPPLGPPTEAQMRRVAEALSVSVKQLDTVMEKYRPDRLRQQ